MKNSVAEKHNHFTVINHMGGAKVATSQNGDTEIVIKQDGDSFKTK